MKNIKAALAGSVALLATACATPREAQASADAPLDALAEQRAALQTAYNPTAANVAPAVAPVDAAAEDAQLVSFLDAALDERVARSPQLLTARGLKDRYSELNIYTEEYRQEGLRLAQEQLAEMRAQFDPERLSPAGRLNYRLAEVEAERDIANFRWRWHGFPATNNGSPLGSIPVFLINQHRISSVEDAEAYISRLREVERVMNEISANMRRQAAMGIVPSAFNFEPVLADGRRVVTGAPFTIGEDTAVFADFKSKVQRLEIPQAEKDRLIAGARQALTGPFRNGYSTMLATLEEIRPLAEGNRGAWSLPEGGEFYAHQLRQWTTTDLTADQVHDIGLREVARIQSEMERIKNQVGFEGSLQNFFRHITTSDQFKYPNTEAGREQYLTDARRYVDQVTAVAPQWFRRLPQAPLEVRAVEEWRQATAPIAFYNNPSADGSRPGIYYVNLTDMNQVLKPQIEAISYHEGAPGHHFQSALTQELTNVPKFRRFGGYGVYSEGWGLYAEGLGKEMGFYQEPISEFGMLSMQLWRAVRLVLDTGIHHKRWSREQAIAYFLENALLSERDISKEVERYFNWPGQATSYTIGLLKIQELREQAERELGDRFDIRDFHAVILENGAVPLDVLEELVVAYIAERRG